MVDGVGVAILDSGSDSVIVLENAEQEQKIQHEGRKEENGENNAKQDHIDLHVVHATGGVGIKNPRKPLQRVRA